MITKACKSELIVLGIESSCDETAASVVKESGGKIEVLSNIVSSQIKIHKKYGGVIPEVAAREHVLNILPVVDEAIKKSKSKIDAIAVTVGPGLVTSLMVGVETAKTLSYVWNKPLIAVNHIEGHIYSNFIGEFPISNFQFPKNNKTIPDKRIFPAIILVVSGGHTSLVLMKGHGKYKLIGETRDDAAGEAFDKAAKLMGIGYPGGPAISKYAKSVQKNMGFKQFKIRNLPAGRQGSKFEIHLPRPMIESKGYDFSFSGLKTALLYQLKKDRSWNERIGDYAAEFQQAVIDVLVSKTLKAAIHYNANSVMLGGGVTANKELRKQMEEAVTKRLDVTFSLPKLDYTTDNAAMIAASGAYKAKAGKYTDWKKIRVDCNMSL